MSLIRGELLDTLGHGYFKDRPCMDTHRVFQVERLHNGDFRLGECCDDYFYVDLTPQELEQLGKELIEAAHDRSVA